MYFKKIDISGFKSFYEPTTIEFENGLTCIVGPNGSGKSNISDAIRFVLGEQSVKSIRGDRMEQIIFSGTDNKKQLGMAEVALTIDNTDKILPIDFEEVLVKRRYFRSGESEYYINNTPCRLKDIKNLFFDTGIGVDGYSIIGQGKISEIISDKEENLREIFYEASGISKYKSEKDQAMRKIEKVNINLSRVTDILSELITREKSLSVESTKAKEYKEISKRHKELEINLILSNIDKLKERESDYSTEYENIEKKLNENIEKKDALVVEVNNLKEEREKDEHLIEEKKNEKHTLEIEVANLEKDFALNKEKLRNIRLDIKRLSEELEDLNNSLTSEEEVKEKRSAEKEKAILEFSEQEKIVNSIKEKKDEEANKIQQKKDEIEELNKEIANINSGLSSKKASIDSLKNFIEEFEQKIQKLENADGNDLNKKESVLLSIEKLKNLISENEIKIKDCIDKKVEFETIISNLTSLDENLKEEKNNAKEELSTLYSRKKTLEEFNKSKEDLGEGVSAVVSRGDTDFKGLVSDIIKVPQGYEVAIEVALNQKLGNLVFSDEDSVKRMINYLKDNRLGRATFLPLNILKSNQISINKEEFNNEEGFIDTALNIVTFEDSYQKLAEYLLGSVVIVKDIETALRLYKKNQRYRYVSLSGDIIFPNGAISGGVYKNKTGLLLTRKTELNELDNKINALNDKIISYDDEFNNLKEKRTEAENYINNLVIEINEASKVKATFEGELNITNERLNALENEGVNSKDELIDDKKRHEENIRNLENEIVNLSSTLEIKTKDFNIKKEELEDLEKATKEETTTDIFVKLKSLEKEKEFKTIDFINSENLIKSIKENYESKSELLKNKKEEEKNLIIELRGSNNELETNDNTELSSNENSSSSESEIDTKNEGDDVNNEIELSHDFIDNKTADYNERIKNLEIEIKELLTNREIKNAALNDKERFLNDLISEIEKTKDSKLSFDIEKSKSETRLSSLKERILEEFGLSMPEAIELKDPDFVFSKAEKENREIKRRINELGPVNLLAIEEYEQVKERLGFLNTQRDDILESLKTYEEIVNKMETAIKTGFKDTFESITLNFKEAFKTLFSGGEADISIEGGVDPLEAKIIISARPPGKRLTNMNLLSGGEKTMTAIALMFSVLKAKPTPFCILDEIDAPLDDKNIERFCNYLLDFHNIQFTLITHQKPTMEYSKIIYGVTMPEKGISKIVSLKLDDKETKEFQKKL